MIRYFGFLLMGVFGLCRPDTMEAQDSTRPHPVAWGGGQGKDYTAVALTEIGYHRTTAGQGSRFLASWGVLYKTGDDDALGPVFFLSGDDAMAYGLELRYRHWLAEHHSFDLGVGMPLYVENSGPTLFASPYFQVRWSPFDFLAVSIRPEYRRRSDNHYFPEDGHSAYVETGKWELSGGLELSGKPGFYAQGMVLLLTLVGFGTAFN